MKHLLQPTAAAVLALALLSACGGGDDGKNTDRKDSASPSSSESAGATEPTEQALSDTDFGPPARGKSVKGKGYAFRMPAKWEEAEPRTKSGGIDTAAQEPSASDGFRDNVTVALQSGPAGSTLDELESSVAGQLEGIVADLDVQPRVVIKGVEALHYRGAATVGSVKYYLEEFVTVDEDGTITVITFSFSPELGATSRAKVTNSVLASWTWQPPSASSGAAEPSASATPTS